MWIKKFKKKMKPNRMHKNIFVCAWDPQLYCQYICIYHESVKKLLTNLKWYLILNAKIWNQPEQSEGTQ